MLGVGPIILVLQAMSLVLSYVGLNKLGNRFLLLFKFGLTLQL